VRMGCGCDGPLPVAAMGGAGTRAVGAWPGRGRSGRCQAGRSRGRAGLGQVVGAQCQVVPGMPGARHGMRCWAGRNRGRAASARG
jgi:hypothetical protein